MESLLNGWGNLDDNIRMLESTGAKFIGRSLCLWGGEGNLERNLERAKAQAPGSIRPIRKWSCRPVYLRILVCPSKQRVSCRLAALCLRLGGANRAQWSSSNAR